VGISQTGLSTPDDIHVMEICRLLSPRSRQRWLYAMVMSICSSVCLFVALSVYETRFSQKLSNLDLQSVLMTTRKSYTGFSKNPIIRPLKCKWRTAAILNIITLLYLNEKSGTNSVHDSRYRTRWQPDDQMWKFKKKFKMADGCHIERSFWL